MIDAGGNKKRTACTEADDSDSPSAVDPVDSSAETTRQPMNDLDTDSDSVQPRFQLSLRSLFLLTTCTCLACVLCFQATWLLGPVLIGVHIFLAMGLIAISIGPKNTLFRHPLFHDAMLAAFLFYVLLMILSGG